MTTITAKILIVEDNIDMLEGQVMVFNLRLQYTGVLPNLLPISGLAIGASTAEMAIRLLQEEGPFHAVLTDIGLGGGRSGFDVIRAIRAGETNRGSNGTPSGILVCVCSGDATEADRQEHKNAGGNHTFVKPLDFNSFLDFCYNWLSRENKGGKQRGENKAAIGE